MALRARTRFTVGFASAGHLVCHGAMILLPLVKTDLAADYGVDTVTVSLGTVLYVVAMGAMAVPAGLLADRVGNARVLLLCPEPERPCVERLSVISERVSNEWIIGSDIRASTRRSLVCRCK